jgi:hypothetical protein
MQLARSISWGGATLARGLQTVVEPPSRQGEALAALPAAEQMRLTGVLAGLAVTGAFAYGAVAHAGPGLSGAAHGALAAVAAAAGAVVLAFPALHIFGTILGARIGLRRLCLLVGHAAGFGGAALLAGVPVVWFFGLALPDSHLRELVTLAVPLLAGLGTASVFLSVVRAADPDRSLVFDASWLLLCAVLTAELGFLLGVLG